MEHSEVSVEVLSLRWCQLLLHAPQMCQIGSPLMWAYLHSILAYLYVFVNRSNFIV